MGGSASDIASAGDGDGDISSAKGSASPADVTNAIEGAVICNSDGVGTNGASWWSLPCARCRVHKHTWCRFQEQDEKCESPFPVARNLLSARCKVFGAMC